MTSWFAISLFYNLLGRGVGAGLRCDLLTLFLSNRKPGFRKVVDKSAEYSSYDTGMGNHYQL